MGASTKEMLIDVHVWQTLPCWLNYKYVYLKLQEEPPLFIPQADSYWPSKWPTLMREFLNIRGCLTHILALNQPSRSHLYHQDWPIPTHPSPPYVSRKEHVACLYSEPQAGPRVEFLRNASPCNLTTPKFGCSRAFLNYKTMPSGFAVIICQEFPCTIPSRDPAVTTNVPMDGNDPRGCTDWQWAEWNQELKVS